MDLTLGTKCFNKVPPIIKRNIYIVDWDRSTDMQQKIRTWTRALEQIYINLCILNSQKCIRKVKQQCWQVADDHHYMGMGFRLTMSRWSGRVNQETEAQQLSCNSDVMNGKSHKRTDLTLNIWFLLLKMRKCECEPHNNKTSHNTQHQYSYSITAQIKASQCMCQTRSRRKLLSVSHQVNYFTIHLKTTNIAHTQQQHNDSQQTLNNEPQWDLQSNEIKQQQHFWAYKVPKQSLVEVNWLSVSWESTSQFQGAQSRKSASDLKGLY